MKVGELKAAIEGREASPQERNVTVGDLARRDDPDFDRHLQRQIATIGPQLQRSMRAMNEALPELMQSLKDAKKSLERAPQICPIRPIRSALDATAPNR